VAVFWGFESFDLPPPVTFRVARLIKAAEGDDECPVRSFLRNSLISLEPAKLLQRIECRENEVRYRVRSGKFVVRSIFALSGVQITL
jgi:hypothetical protein